MKPSELLLKYPEFEKLDKSKLDKFDQCWLNIWNTWDIMCSPMPDEERRFIRYGHYLGFVKGLEEI